MSLINWDALVQVLIAAVIAGLGGVVAFSAGLLSLSFARGGEGGEGAGDIVTGSRRRTIGVGTAVLCFAAVAVGIGLGLHAIIAK